MSRPISLVAAAARRLFAPARAASIAAALAVSPGPSAAQATDDEYEAAICMNRYNTDPSFRALQADTPEHPLIDLRIKPQVSAGAVLGAGLPGGGRAAVGGTADADTLIGVSSGAHSRLGFTMGLSAIALTTPSYSYGVGGELRLGFGRRRFGAAQLDPLSRFRTRLGGDPCRFERLDLKLDFLRWRLLGIVDTVAAGHPALLMTSVSVFSLSLGFQDKDGGIRSTVSLGRVRLTPSVQWGPNIEVEKSWSHFLLSGALGAYCPKKSLYFVIGTGVHFELHNGISIN
jgi:hypothetical protein